MSESIVGKDYLTRQEAALYACMSLRHWDAMSRLYGIRGIPWAGKLVYRKSDIQRAIERAASGDNPKAGQFVGTPMVRKRAPVQAQPRENHENRGRQATEA